MFNAGHPDDDVLEQYAMASLPEDAAASIEEHILVCGSCQDRLDSTETYIRSMKSALAKASLPKGPGRAFRKPALLWATATAVLLLAIGALFGSRYFAGSGPPVAIVLTATRGETASIHASGPLELKLDARDLLPGDGYRVRIVNSEGTDVWDQAAAGIQDGYVQILVKKHLGSGQYFVRLIPPAAGTPREYSLQLR